MGRRVRRVLLLGTLLTAVGLGAGVALVLRPFDTTPYLEAPQSPVLLDRHGARLYVGLAADDHWSLPLEHGAWSAHLLHATLAVEDERFHRHPGVDPLAVARAAWQNAWQGRVVSGASTLTMQLVTLQDGGAGWRGKLWQAWHALRLDANASKGALLRGYFNRAPYGRNLRGVEAAALRYFGQPAHALRLPEAALLAGLPKAPSALDPLRHADAARARRNHVLRRMADCGYIDDAAAQRAQAAPLGVRWHRFPRHAPHVAQRALGQAPGSTVQALLDAEVQGLAYDLLRAHLKTFDGAIGNGAVLVLDVQDGAARAWVGSAGVRDTPGGAIDLARAPRSPGSALKPFTYAVAMEAQQLYPDEQLLDDTLDYGHYRPGNFDGRFHGRVSAADALRHSLNVPAVAVLERAGVGALYTRLQQLGFSTLRQPPAHYGLGLTLGNCAVRLDALAAAYCTIARLGDAVPLRVLQGGAYGSAHAPLDPATCAALYTMLEQSLPGTRAAGLPRVRRGPPRVAYKTGTSTGYFDAWTIMFNRHWVVAVWLGNPDGRSAPQLVGAEAALPLAARLFRRLPKRDTPAWPDVNAHLRETEVCPASGLIHTQWCPDRATSALPCYQWRHRRCTVHGPGAAAVWPARAQQWDLAQVNAAAPPAITHPASGASYVLTGDPQGDVIALEAEGRQPFHWYVNGRHVAAEAGADAPLWRLRAGTHTVACMDARGRVGTVQFDVLRPDGAALRP